MRMSNCPSLKAIFTCTQHKECYLNTYKHTQFLIELVDRGEIGLVNLLAMNMACREQPGLRRDESLRFAWTIQESHACKQVQAGQLTVSLKKRFRLLLNSYRFCAAATAAAPILTEKL